MTLVILSYASPALLLNHLETIRSYSKQTRRALDVLVIDDGSPPGLDAAPFITPRHAEGLHSLKVVAITEDLAWNIGGARNLAFHIAATKRVLMLDADTVLAPEMVDAHRPGESGTAPKPGASENVRGSGYRIPT